MNTEKQTVIAVDDAILKDVMLREQFQRILGKEMRADGTITPEGWQQIKSAISGVQPSQS